MNRSLGVGYCGLVCALCSENEGCVGCKKGGCPQKDSCKNYLCCTAKGYDGCHRCPAFPCTDSILHKTRIRAFERFIARCGEEALLDCMERNERQGLVYHYPGGHIGDYDRPQSEEEIIALVLNGKEQTT